MPKLLLVQKNLAFEMQSIAADILAIKSRISVATAMFAAENMGDLADADIQAIAPLAHVTGQELTAAKNAMDAIGVTIGEYVAGSNATKLTKIITGRVVQ